MTVDTEDTVSPSDLERKNLTEWANEPTVGILKEDLEASKPSHDAEVGKIHNYFLRNYESFCDKGNFNNNLFEKVFRKQMLKAFGSQENIDKFIHEAGRF